MCRVDLQPALDGLLADGTKELLSIALSLGDAA